MLILWTIFYVCLHFIFCQEVNRANIRSDSLEELESFIRWSRGDIKRLARFERTLISSGIDITLGSPEHGQMIESWPEMTSVKHSYAAQVASRTAIRFSYAKCKKYSECVKSLHLMNLNNSSLSSQGCSTIESYQCNKLSTKYRSVDGSCILQHDKGRSFTPYRRILAPAYSDEIQAPRLNKFGKELPSARAISLALSNWDDKSREHSRITTTFPLWTQFILNDLSHTPISKMVNTFASIECCDFNGGKLAPRYLHPDCLPIHVNENDSAYQKIRVQCINYVRSAPAIANECHLGPRQQMNQATHFLDGSTIYGSTEKVANDLRSTQNKGQLNVQNTIYGDLLPSNKDTKHQCQYTANRQSTNETCFKAGDSRVNLSPYLSVIHTIFIREHNRIANQLSIINPSWNNDRVYQETRHILIAEIQHITYTHWLPILLGEERSIVFSQNTSDYNDDPSISNAFAHAAMRFAENMLDDDIRLYDESRKLSDTLQLRDHFNKPNFIKSPKAIENLVRGLTTQNGLENDLSYEPDFSHGLYRNNWNFGLDLFALDIQRGRDHGLPSYKRFKEFCNVTTNTIPKKLEVLLKQLYGTLDDVDLIVGGLSEKPLADGILGPTFSCLIEEQLLRTQFADKYFYKNKNEESSFSSDQLNEIKKSSLARILCDNTKIESIQPNVFTIISPSNSLIECTSNEIPHVHLHYWKE